VEQCAVRGARARAPGGLVMPCAHALASTNTNVYRFQICDVHKRSGAGEDDGHARETGVFGKYEASMTTRQKVLGDGILDSDSYNTRVTRNTAKLPSSAIQKKNKKSLRHEV